MKKGKVEKIENEEQKQKKLNKIANIIIGIVLVVALLVGIDLLCITKGNVGPFFAIRTNVYKDGGTKVYYGLGYKVIKYNQINGKKGTKVGFWTMKYDVNPKEVSILDLALNYGNDARGTYKKYYDEYLKITGTIETVDNQKKIVTLRYQDDDAKNKYTLDFVIETNLEDVSMYTKGQKITIRGSLKGYKEKTKDTPAQLIFRDGYIGE